jgi:dienelactone hydrolase
VANKSQLIEYEVDGLRFVGFLALPEGPGPFPGVAVFHNWYGQNDNERQRARDLAALGYAAFAVDLYGAGERATDNESASALMTPLVNDRAGLLLKRTQAALGVLEAQPEVQAGRIAAVGYCLGGLCVLDLARSGAALKGVVSVHGLLGSADFEGAKPSAAVLVLHGYDDPLAKPDKVLAFGTEMTALGLDWQVHAYGGTSHAFSTPGADYAPYGLKYSARADRRSWQAMRNFLAEVL